MLCAGVAPDGSVYLVDPQPVDTSSCGLVIQSAFEVASTPWALDPSAAAEVGGAVLFVWAVAYAFRLAIRALHIGDDRDAE